MRIKLEIFYIITLLISGWITCIMTFFVKMAGGGASLMVVLTSPVLIGLSVIFFLLHYYAFRKAQSEGVLFGLFFSSISLILMATCTSYPYA